MKVLVLGAGGVGGYFGGRLLAAGRDVTFLVRPKRAERLAATGLEIRSEREPSVVIADPPTKLASEIREPYDLVLLSCKAYDLVDSIEAVAPAVGPGTMILPLLNGIRHLEVLDERFGVDRVFGGRCFITSRLDEGGRVIHRGAYHELAFGPRSEAAGQQVEAMALALGGAGFPLKVTREIELEMWEKWVFLATFAGSHCLMRASSADIVAAGGVEQVLAMFEECCQIATAHGFAPGESCLERSHKVLTSPQSTATASMLGDVERGGRTEADHILGDLLRRCPEGPAGARWLQAAYLAIKSHEARMRREGPLCVRPVSRVE